MRQPLPMRAALAALVVTTLLTPWGRDLFVGDETKYSQVVREMRASGSWFLPTLEGTPFTHKPPLHFWIVDALTLAFGTHSIWPFVLPSLAAFALLVWLMAAVESPLAAFVCGSAVLVWGSAQSARMDVGFTLGIALAAFMIRRFFDRSDRRALLVAGTALGVATMLKGPMAPVIAILLFALEAWRRRGVPRANYLPALAAMVLIPLVWFVPAMLLGGNTYTHEVLGKQLAGRAVGAWVHRSPPWYYLLHSPLFLFPWFGAAAAAIAARWREERFHINWILAVLVPYSLMSSKLDVYMMALVPPVAAIIAGTISRVPRSFPDAVSAGAAAHAPGMFGVRISNAVTAAVLLLAGVAGLIAGPRFVRGPDAALASSPAVKGLLVVLALAAGLALILSLRGALASTVALGFVPVAALVWVALAMMPLVGEMATTRPLIRALAAQGVPADSIALYTCPHLWSRDMPRELDAVRYVSPDRLRELRPAVIATSRAHASEIAPSLAGYRKVAAVRMIGKWFDVYRR